MSAESAPENAAEAAVQPARAVVVTQLGAAEPAAAMCAIAGLPVDAVLSGVGVLVWCRDTSVGGPEQVAATITRATPGLPAVLLVHRDGQITAHTWLDGAVGDELAAGLALDGAPEGLTNLLLGTETVDDFPDVVTSVGVGRLKAVRMMTKAGRAARRDRKKAV
ncbi:hypothetical protein GCM10025864_41210 [Luteimicrobium album]|uniref:Uncharacterized protein n=1 Tax=Luteimicrobium album TaxID=1054550 RepID=A0ABQ6I7G8_9MICO|nr:hypothetical protein [Luteimicrobium album]GMA26362.1 hypothetical protein GCM10025864_41210 [Luteimicrobium album]